jgi:nucleoid DNA-binding protein
MEKQIYTKESFVKLLAEKARFTQGDIKVILDSFEEIVKDIIKNGDELILTGIFHLYIQDIDAHEGYDPVRQIKQEVKKSKRIVFKASRTLLDLFK